jgi:hypothetical protein
MTRVPGWSAIWLAALVVAGCASTSQPRSSDDFDDFVGHRWRITVVQHGPSRVAIPASSGAWIEFKSDGQFGADDGINGYGGTFIRTSHGYRLGNDIVGSAVGIGTSPGAPPSTLAVVDAVRPMIMAGADVDANVESGQLHIATAGYQITAIPITA